MAEGNWRFFHKGMKGLFKGSYNMSALNKWQMVLLESAGVAAAADLDTSTTGSLSLASIIAKGQGDSITRTFTPMLTATASGNWKFKHDPVVFTATTGSTFSANYAAVIYSGVATPFAICQLSTNDVVAAQITVNSPTDGLFAISASYTIA